MFFFARDYVTKAEGSVLKTVDCAHCGHQYVYEMKRKATGKGLSVYYLDNQGAQDRSQRDARVDLTHFSEIVVTPFHALNVVHISPR